MDWHISVLMEFELWLCSDFTVMISTLKFNKSEVTVPQLPGQAEIFSFCIRNQIWAAKKKKKNQRNIHQFYSTERHLSTLWIIQGDYGVMLCLQIQITLGWDAVSETAGTLGNVMNSRALINCVDKDYMIGDDGKKDAMQERRGTAEVPHSTLMRLGNSEVKV